VNFDVERLRRYVNRLDRWLDRASLVEATSTRIDLDKPAEPVTARQAFSSVLPVARRVDGSARLKLITASENLDASGTASRWEFFFDLPKRRAKATVAWVLPLTEEFDSYRSPIVEAVFRPFPMPGSLFYRMIDEGRLLYRQLNGHWRDEMQRTPDLPKSFKDSDLAMRELSQRGLDVGSDEASLTAKGVSETEIVWMAQTRYNSYQTSIQ